MLWNEELKIGVEQVDAEHKEMCNRIDLFFEACRQARGKQELFEMIGFLEAYANQHFRHEELLQMECNYPKMREHVETHLYFREKIAELKQEVAENGASLAVVSNANSFLTDWFLQHIRKMDKDIAQYIK